MKTVISNKAWDKLISTPVQKKEQFTTTKAGVTGIIRNVETKARDTDKNLQEAFADISVLMEKAKEMVALAERFSAEVAKEDKKNGEEELELRSMLISVGIASPVTKESAGSLCHTQLSRQLADWLRGPLEKHGMISLQDLYCIFNRARGTEMISPDDLYRACVLFEQLKLPVRLRRFDSGVLVVQSLNQTDAAVGKQISDLIRLDGPQSAFDLAKNKNISIALATEQLLTAEKLGIVCRDETYGGLVFYLNFFNDLKLVDLFLKSMK